MRDGAASARFGCGGSSRMRLGKKAFAERLKRCTRVAETGRMSSGVHRIDVGRHRPRHVYVLATARRSGRGN